MKDYTVAQLTKPAVHHRVHKNTPAVTVNVKVKFSRCNVFNAYQLHSFVNSEFN